MSDLARVFPFPGVDTDPPVTFEEYLASAGLAPATIVNYSYFVRRALEECEQMGVDLHTVDSEMLLTMAHRVAEVETSRRKALGAALSHWFRYEEVDDPPHWVEWSPTSVKVAGSWERSANYEDYLVSVGLAPGTIRNYAWHVNRAAELCQEMGGDLCTASPQMLVTVADEIGPSHSMRAQLRSGLKYYYRWQNRNDAPLSAVRVPPQPQLVCQALEPDEARALIETARGWWPQGAAVLLGMYLASRREEIAKAEWSRFDDNMEWYRVTGKRDKTATIPVHPVVVEEFAPLRTTGFIFPGRTGVRDHVSPATVWKWTKEVARAAGLGDVRTHQLRHTSLTTALDNTENLRSVMEFARHSRPQTTAGYTRTTKEQLWAVMEALDY